MGKILVVEDNDVLRGSVVQALVENGHNVSEVGDGEEATERLQEEELRRRIDRHADAEKERTGSAAVCQTGKRPDSRNRNDGVWHD